MIRACSIVADSLGSFSCLVVVLGTIRDWTSYNGLNLNSLTLCTTAVITNSAVFTFLFESVIHSAKLPSSSRNRHCTQHLTYLLLGFEKRLNPCLLRLAK